MLRGFFDRCDRAFSPETAESLYRERLAYFQNLVQEYLLTVHPDRLLEAGVPFGERQKYLRHLYFTDCRSYVSLPEKSPGSHMASASYEAEFKRNFRLLGEIPRTTMLRHLIVLGNPFLSEKLLSDRLARLGYHPLDAEHTTVKGFRLDELLIRLLGLYQEVCAGQKPEVCRQWFSQACRILDEAFVTAGHPQMRFMYFKSLSGKGVEG